MKELIIDALLDTIKLLPYLFITFIVLEFIEHKFSKNQEKILSKNKSIGPLIGGILGGFPQCGFSVIASRLFSSRIITIGTIIAVYLATSDEMIPIMISEKVNILVLLKIIGFKVLIGIIIGFIVDLIYKRKDIIKVSEFTHECEDSNCHCDEKGIFLSSVIHTFKIGLFILIANLLIGLIIHLVGEDKLGSILLNKNIFTYFLASLIGLIPNCSGSVIITELYISNLITIGTMLSGLLTGSGIGILLLFKTNKNLKENIFILSFIYLIGVIIGIVVDLII